MAYIIYKLRRTNITGTIVGHADQPVSSTSAGQSTTILGEDTPGVTPTTVYKLTAQFVAGSGILGVSVGYRTIIDLVRSK